MLRVTTSGRIPSVQTSVFGRKYFFFGQEGGELEVELWLNYFFANTDPGFLFSGTVISQLVRIKIFHSFEVCKV